MDFKFLFNKTENIYGVKKLGKEFNKKITSSF